MTLRAFVLLALVTATSSARGEDVLVWYDSALYVEASRAADHVVIGSMTGARDRNLGAVVEMEVLSRDGDFLEVTPQFSSCRYRSFLNVDERLDKPHFYVQQSDVAPVLTRPWSKTFDDGTQIVLQPGEPIGPLVGKTRTIDLSSATAPGAATLQLEIPDDAVGQSFERHAIWQAKHPSTRTDLELIAPRVALGGHTVSLSWDALFVGMEEHGKRALVTLDMGCEQVVVGAARSQVGPKREHPPGLVGVLRGSEPQPPSYVPRGTPIVSKSGKQVAVARYDFAARPAKDDRTCLAFPVGATKVKHGDGSVTLCVASSAIRTAATPAPTEEPATARRVFVRLDAATVSGGVDAATARRVLNNLIDPLHACDASQATGKVTASFIVQLDGSIANVHASGIADVDSCVAGVIAKAHFPRPDGVGQVTSTFIYR